MKRLLLHLNFTFLSLKPHILVWRLSAMGDVAMSVPVLKRLTEKYPDVKITIVSKPFFEPIFNDIKNINFIAIDVKKAHRGVVGLFSFYKDLKQLGITHFADLHNVLRSKIMRNFFRTSGIPIAFIDKGRSEKKELIKEKKKTISQLKTTHQRYADVFNHLGFEIDLQPVKRKIKNLNNKIKNLVGEKNTTWIGIAPFAAFKGKMYPTHLMKEALKSLSKINCKILLFGGGKEEIKALEELSSGLKNAEVIAGNFNFNEELALISNLDIMVSMDSGNAHLAAMFGVDTLTLWGVTHPYAGFAPFGQNEDYQILPDIVKHPLLPCSIYGNKVFPGYENVMETIDPKTILKKVTEVLTKKELL